MLDQSVEDRGIALAEVVGTPTAPRELVLGLDFGSSSTKLVICDRAAGQSFAVAIADVAGERRYLLPTAVRHCGDCYTLDGEGLLHTELKSDLLASPADDRTKERVVAYLALVIRRARGWLFSAHGNIYRNVPIVWTLTIGIPKRQGETSEYFDLYKRLAAAAWQVAGNPGPISARKVVAALQRNGSRPIDDETVEVRVTPEIAAEIYGFVSSESFDPHANNIFLMVDVGGKTLDASLFHVRRGKANQWSFSFFTSEVFSLGAIELHLARINWWQEMLRKADQGNRGKQLIADLEAMKRISTFEETMPSHVEDYVRGVTLELGSEDGRSPDKSFCASVSNAVRRRAYEDAIDVQVPARQMEDIPYFLCGGGSRMTLYSSTVHRAMARRGTSPFYATPRTLRVPANLQAPGLEATVYDRFAVAYGLSQLDAAGVVDAEPLPPIEAKNDSDLDYFVSKEMC